MLVELIAIAILIAALFIGDAVRRGDLTVTWKWVAGAFVCWAAVVVLVGDIVWRYPAAATRELKTAAAQVGAPNSKDRFEAQRDASKAEADTRMAMLQAVGGLVLLGGLYFTYRTLTGTARAALLQRFGEAIALLNQETALERAAGKSMLEAIMREPEGKDLGIPELLALYAGTRKEADPAGP